MTVAVAIACWCIMWVHLGPLDWVSRVFPRISVKPFNCVKCLALWSSLITFAVVGQPVYIYAPITCITALIIELSLIRLKNG